MHVKILPFLGRKKFVNITAKIQKYSVHKAKATIVMVIDEASRMIRNR